MSLQNFRNYLTAVPFMAVLFFLFSMSIAGRDLTDTNWRVTFQTGRDGPVEAVLAFEKSGDEMIARSRSGARGVIKKFPLAKDEKVNIEKYLFAFTLKKTDTDYSGEMIAPWRDGKVTLSLNENGFQGKISGGRFEGSFTGVPFEAEPKPLRDYPAVVDSLVKTVGEKIFDPRVLREAGWKKLTNDLKSVADSAADDFDLILGFHFAYENKPFSHLTLGRARVPALELMTQFDSFRVGGTPASLQFENDLAILTVKTMIGVDTTELIEAAYQEIGKKNPKALIIDLRGNGGGAFAIKPLIEHIIDKPLDAGFFLTHKWNLFNERQPTRDELNKVRPWEGFSLKAWWENVQSEPIIRLKFTPAEPNFDGPVFVLIDAYSASATEMAVDVLAEADNVLIVGEKTAGQVLSQSPFDLAGGFQAFIPVGDYYSFAHGRIEGIGVKPDVEVKSAEAWGVAKKLAEKGINGEWSK